jgi:hypothetical protein
LINWLAILSVKVIVFGVGAVFTAATLLSQAIGKLEVPTTALAPNLT